MNEYTMELVDRFAALLEENARMRLQIDLLKAVTKNAEVKDAKYEITKTYGDPCYDAEVKCETINDIFGWEVDPDAYDMIETALAFKRKEREDGDSVRTDE